MPFLESVNLRTTVAFANTSANFSCYDESAGEIPEIDLEVNGESVKKASLTGIEWEYINKEKNIGFKIVIAANLQTNNTELQCFLSPCVSNTASLIVVDGKHYVVLNRQSLRYLYRSTSA